jgi:hypothetical protein
VDSLEISYTRLLQERLDLGRTRGRFLMDIDTYPDHFVCNLVKQLRLAKTHLKKRLSLHEPDIAVIKSRPRGETAMLVSLKLKIFLKRVERVLVITGSISEAHEDTAILLIRLELADVEVMCLYGLETLMQALQEIFLA